MSTYRSFAAICALVPIYREGQGDTTEIHRVRQTPASVQRPLTVVWRDLLAQRGFDERLLRKQSGRLLGPGHNLPLFIEEGALFVPLRVRQARVRGDATAALVNFFQVIQVEREGRSVALRLSDGAVLPTATGWTSVRAQMQRAEALMSRIRPVPTTLSEEEGVREMPALWVKRPTTHGEEHW
ncbi:MAG: hypothetical protein IMW91_05205 [Firmicutes bacterium]|nr:hypothetical protein [Bacillota bacterium]